MNNNKATEIIFLDYLCQRKRGLVLAQLEEYLFIYDLDEKDTNVHQFPDYPTSTVKGYDTYSEIRRVDEVKYLNDVDVDKVDNLYMS